MRTLYTYRCEVLNITDGDTIEVFMDRGMDDFKHCYIRFLGINTPEKNTPEGVAAKEYLTQLIGSRKYVYVMTEKPDKYSKRFLGRVYLELLDEKKSINEMLLEAGYAKPYGGTGQKL